MGRSVMTARGAVAIAYLPYYEEDEEYIHYDEFVMDLQERIEALFPSMSSGNVWIENEVNLIAENYHGYVTISEYCGLVALCLVPQENAESPALAESWCRRVADKFENEFGTLTRLGTMSNGVGVFAKK